MVKICGWWLKAVSNTILPFVPGNAACAGPTIPTSPPRSDQLLPRQTCGAWRPPATRKPGVQAPSLGRPYGLPSSGSILQATALPAATRGTCRVTRIRADETRVPFGVPAKVKRAPASSATPSSCPERQEHIGSVSFLVSYIYVHRRQSACTRRSLRTETDLSGRSCTVIFNTEKLKVGSSILPLITTHPVVLAVLTSANAYSAPSCRYQLSDHGCPCVTGVCRTLSHADRTPPRCRALLWLFLPVRPAAVWGDSALPMAAPQKG
jgi:hypothetical protein